MHAIDVLLDNFGVESFGPVVDSYRHTPKYSYSNAGDSYAATVIYDNETGRYRIGSWGDLAERMADVEYY